MVILQPTEQMFPSLTCHLAFDVQVRVLDLSSIQLSQLRVLDASRPQATGDFGWIKLACSGQPPNAVEGAAFAVWEGRHSILVSGGVGADGKVRSSTHDAPPKLQ